MTVQRTDTVPFVDLVGQHAPLREALLEAAGRVIDHGRFILGPEVAELEERWAKRCGVSHTVAVSNGSMALLLVLRALGIGPGDEVVTAPNSFVASASSAALLGARPRFADVSADLNVDPASVRACLSERTKAVIAVHLTGRPVAMDEILKVAAQRGVPVIEDAAQAMGARYAGRPVGGLARAACFSLHPLKTPGACGDGGMITTNDGALAEQLRLLGNHGIRHRQEDCRTWGFNARMDTLQAALALVKLDYLDEWIKRRRAHAAIYRDRLGGIVRMPVDRPEDFAVYHTFPVETDRRDELVEFLRAHEVGCAVHYRVPIHRLDAARELGYGPGDLPETERQARRLISLPVHEGLSEAQIHHVCDRIESFHASAVSASTDRER